jgi:hypothetical protein
MLQHGRLERSVRSFYAPFMRRHRIPHGVLMPMRLAPYRNNLEASAMADIAYLALGVGIIALMALYARWASST